MSACKIDFEAERKRLTDIFLESVSNDRFFQLAQGIVKDDRHTTGPRYLVGSFIYRKLIKLLHNPDLVEPKEINYLVSKHKSKDTFILPEQWNVKHNKGRPYISSNDGRKVTVSTLSSFHFIRDDQRGENIGNYLGYVPFNINAIAFDLQSNRIIGKSGIEAISERILRISNMDAVKHYIKKNNIDDIDRHLREKAESLGFRYVETS
ncbi:MAG: hypothetical protein Q7R87_03575 [Nanoarchaeota archaeon]|nr:hypothetical protein [Nanoarchaeota archaeon]